MTENAERSDEIVALPDENCQFVNCNELAVYRCHKCSRLFCIEHSSEIDPVRWCTECMSVADCNVIEMPLVDSDGTRHRGRVLRPVGRAFIENGRLIGELTDGELKDFIISYQKLLHDAESIVNLYRISLTQATHTALDREIVKQKPSGELYFPPPRPQSERKVSKTKDPVDRVVAAMNKAGVTPEMIAKMLADRKAKKVG